MTHYAEPPRPEDAAILRLIREGHWRRSRAWLDPHEYIVATGKDGQPELYQAILARLKGADAWQEVYDVRDKANDAVARDYVAKGARPVRFRYVALARWKYWLSKYPVLNRAPLPPPPDDIDCELELIAGNMEEASATGYRMTDMIGTVWVIFRCPWSDQEGMPVELLEHWHVMEVPPD